MSQLFLHFLTRLGNCFNEKQKVGLAKNNGDLANWVTIVDGPTFLTTYKHNWFAQPCQLVKGQTIKPCMNAVVGSWLVQRVIFFLIIVCKCFQGQLFSLQCINRALFEAFQTFKMHNNILINMCRSYVVNFTVYDHANRSGQVIASWK